MAAAAHTPGGYGGVPQSVGKDFNKSDKVKKFSTKHVAAALRNKHLEPDSDQKGGMSDKDADNA